MCWMEVVKRTEVKRLTDVEAKLESLVGWKRGEQGVNRREVLEWSHLGAALPILKKFYSSLSKFLLA